MDLKGNVPEIAFQAEIFHSQDFFFWFPFTFIIVVIQGTPDHGVYNVVQSNVFVEFTGGLSVSHDQHSVADFEDFVHLVADIYHTNALSFQFVDDFKQRIFLLFCERRCGLIQYQDFCSQSNSPGDFYHLLLGNGQRGDHILWFCRALQFIQNFLSILIHFLPVNPAAFFRQAAQI